MYSASSHIAVALIVIEVFISLERDPVEQRPHVAEVADRDADLADLARRHRMVGVVPGLRRQVEGDRQAGLTLGQVLLVELVGGPRARVARVGPEEPGLVLRVIHAPSRSHGSERAV